MLGQGMDVSDYSAVEVMSEDCQGPTRTGPHHATRACRLQLLLEARSSLRLDSMVPGFRAVLQALDQRD